MGGFGGKKKWGVLFLEGAIAKKKKMRGGATPQAELVGEVGGGAGRGAPQWGHATRNHSGRKTGGEKRKNSRKGASSQGGNLMHNRELLAGMRGGEGGKSVVQLTCWPVLQSLKVGRRKRKKTSTEKKKAPGGPVHQHQFRQGTIIKGPNGGSPKS